MPTDTGATDVNGAAALLSQRIQQELPQPTDEDNVEPEAEETQPETPEEAETADTKEDEPRYKVKVDGEELEVTLDELQKGYMLESNYRNKTTALNKEREAIESKAAEVDQQLSEARSLIESEIESLESAEMLELKEHDPEAYIKKQEKIQEKVKKFEALQQKRQDEHKARQEKFLKKERELLFDAFPEWKNDQAKMAQESNELMKVMETMGYSKEEVANMTDHRMFVLAQKVQQFNKIQNANIESKKVKAKPKNAKPGQPRDKADRQNDAIKAKWDRLKQTGSRNAAMDILSTPVN